LPENWRRVGLTAPSSTTTPERRRAPRVGRALRVPLSLIDKGEHLPRRADQWFPDVSRRGESLLYPEHLEAVRHSRSLLGGAKGFS